MQTLQPFDIIVHREAWNAALSFLIILPLRVQTFGIFVNSSPTVGEEDAREQMAIPVEDRIFFAGEAVAPVVGMVHTANDSGRFAAEQVLASLH